MAQNFQIATFANVVTTTATGNVGISNSAPADTLSINGTTYFSGNVKFSTTAGIQANASFGTTGQVLASNGSTVYWVTPVTTGKSIAMAIVFGG